MQSGDATEVRLRLDGPPPGVEPSRLSGRVVLDLPGVTPALRGRGASGEGPCLTRVRVGEHPGYLRVVLDLARECAVERSVAGETIVVALVPPAGMTAEPPPELPPRGGRQSPGVLLRASGDPAGAAEEDAEPEPAGEEGAVLPKSTAESREDAPPAEPAPEPEAASEPEAPEALAEGTTGVASVPEEGDEAPSESEDEDDEEDEAEPAPAATATIDEASQGLFPALPPLPVKSWPTPAPAAREDALVSIEFRNTDVRTVLDLVARAGGHRVIFNPEVKGKVTVKALDRPWRDVFADVLRKARLQSVEHQDLLLVEPLGTR